MKLFPIHVRDIELWPTKEIKSASFYPGPGGAELGIAGQAEQSKINREQSACPWGPEHNCWTLDNDSICKYASKIESGGRQVNCSYDEKAECA